MGDWAEQALPKDHPARHRHSKAALKIESMPKSQLRCSAWDGQQCQATKNLTACALTIQQGAILKAPDKVVVHLCPKHFKLDRPKNTQK
jgi:hypothetical protein